ncbi:uncharacterized protein LOC128545909 [Mercenaria mercenaria]|uniref:uncharacterized protein LOC128545909 n=1 Tax=Mercenaria mercenaria TaxID=6596 RepID=UPI00234F6393|nr:uncharacterized protein LOC128545909 [Mercenaria mercenaria]
MKAFLLGILLIITANCQTPGNDSKEPRQEPRCYSKFDYDYKLLQKLTKLEERQETMQVLLNSQNGLIDELKEQLRVSLLPQWGDWSPWSDCYMNCTGKHGGRIQSRSRETISHSPTQGPQQKAEERPCNAVQFAGCIKSYGTDDNFGVTYDFADQIAVSTCTALLSGGNYVYAIRRKCSALSVSCAETCKHVGKTCFNALHVYRSSTIFPRDQYGALGLFLYKYNSCSGNYCGPNFCCCHN